jgi:hypothetical protein
MTFNVVGVGLSGAVLAGTSVLAGIFATSPQRSILWNGFDSTTGAPQLDASGNPVQAYLFPQVTIEERHLDRLRKTDHPVEQGANVADHAFKLPAEVTVRAGWAFGGNKGPSGGSILSAVSNVITSMVPKPTDVNELRKLYGVLLSIQANRALVTLQTGKRRYTNMLLETLAVDTDETTENALVYVANFSEIIFAQTHIVSVPPAANMRSPQTTGATVSQGSTSLLPGSSINTGSANAALLAAGKAPL